MLRNTAIAAILTLGASSAFAASDAPTGFTKCVQLGATCSMTGTHQAAIGKSGVFAYKTFTGNFACTLANFPGAPSNSSWCSYNPANASASSSSVSSVASSSASSKSSSVASSAPASSSSSSKSSAASSSVVASSSSSAASSVASGTVDAKTLTGASTPLQTAQYGVRNYSAPVTVDGLHNPSNYKAAPKLPTWQFATVDPTGGKLTFERDVAPANGWHGFYRKGKATVSGGSSAAANRVYTVFNGQQLVAAINEAGNDPKIIRVVGHIDLRWSSNNTVFKEYTSYSDQKYGGSIMIPSNTTLVGINSASGAAARITGTTILIGGELSNGAVDAETGFKSWIASGKDGDDYPTWTRNIIIRNLQLDTPWDVNPEDSANAYSDGMTITRTQNLWIDHLTISDGDTPSSLSSDTRHDGALDVVRGSDYVTIANSYFFKHDKTTLVGNGDSGRAWSDEGRLHVTFSGNWWNSLGSRLPLNRFGQVHLFNNLVTGSTSTSDSDLKFGGGLDARYKSNMLVQNNYYSFTGLKLSEVCGKVIKGKDFIGFRSSGHLFTSDKADTSTGTAAGAVVSMDGQCGYATPSGANVWTPPYAYTLQTAAATLTSVQANAGAGKLK